MISWNVARNTAKKKCNEAILEHAKLVGQPCPSAQNPYYSPLFHTHLSKTEVPPHVVRIQHEASLVPCGSLTRPPLEAKSRPQWSCKAPKSQDIEGSWRKCMILAELS